MNALHTQGRVRARVICADDNPLVGAALERFITRSPDFEWMGCADDADQLCEKVRSIGCPHLVLLDIDMPGMDPFTAVRELAVCCPDARVLMYSGIVRRDLIDRAIEAGAWGYVSKGDGEAALFDAMRAVLAGDVAFSPEARRTAGL